MLRLSASEKLERGLQHTPQEIAQQPRTWRRTLDRLQAQRDELQAFLGSTGLRDQPEHRPTVFLVGAGTSDYIGRSLHHLLRRCWQCEVIPVASTSLLTDFSDYVIPGRRYLWISFSRSGNSPEGVAVLERALAECPQIDHLLVSCNGSGRMMQAIEGRARCHALVLDDEVNDRSLAMTSSFTNMVLTGQFLAHLSDPDSYTPIVDALATAAEWLMPRAAQLASDLVNEGYSRVCFLGSGGLAGAAMESALKVLELTAGRVLSLSQATLALRHGPMAALDGDTLLVAFISSQAPRRSYELDLLREIGAKGLVRTRVAVSADPQGLSGEAEHVLAPEAAAAIPDACRPMFDVLFGQMLGLFASIHAGLQPDSPSPTGAISRVVPELSIY
ncbi:MAG TPA: tagatose-6-phosphate ketose isomerase [Acidobacteriaceae bacterium]|nr:tagatose-6-phosphate ketose isomerase [Acidobacteriaceae bacterium]